ncbi:PEP-CTERM sorting domain-containing protein [uncultured Paraglaciecola sp.]|uniref:PEP-CTERM sorting domain-containing protein n=1 Tax=uncultured Paraglaciecola sp. TaxID=1765024 RepID=UPI002607203B|nr:PEP-CTERM sorting domain-containing protein [uncultured Paraglaciecola sp.]
MSIKMLKAALAGLVLSVSSFANAGLITFNFNGADNDLASVIKTVNGVTLTASSFSPDSLSTADADGLCISGGGEIASFCGSLNDLTLTFSHAVKLISYEVGYLSTGNSGANILFTQGLNFSLQSNFVDENTDNFTNQFNVVGNQSINVSASNLGGNGSLQFRQITIDDSVNVPEPSTLAIFALGLMGLASRRFKKQ